MTCRNKVPTCTTAWNHAAAGGIAEHAAPLALAARRLHVDSAAVRRSLPSADEVTSRRSVSGKPQAEQKHVDKTYGRLFFPTLMMGFVYCLQREYLHACTV